MFSFFPDRINDSYYDAVVLINNLFTRGTIIRHSLRTCVCSSKLGLYYVMFNKKMKDVFFTTVKQIKLLPNIIIILNAGHNYGVSCYIIIYCLLQCNLKINITKPKRLSSLVLPKKLTTQQIHESRKLV